MSAIQAHKENKSAQTSEHVAHFHGVTSLIIARGGNNLAQISKYVGPFHAMSTVITTYSNDVTTNGEIVARKFAKIVKKP